MENVTPSPLEIAEREIARELWEDLSQGEADAHHRLREVPEAIRAAILRALVMSMDTRSTINPFL